MSAQDTQGKSFSSREQRVAETREIRDRSQLSWPSMAALAAPGDIAVRTCRILSLVAASLIAIAPAQAIAQVPNDSVSVRDRARPEYDPLGMRLGGFDLNAELFLGVETTDNLFATQSGTEVSDTYFHVAPSAQLRSHWGRHALAFVAGADSTNHEDFSTEDSDTYYFGAYGRLDVGSRSDVFGNARWAHEVEPRTNPDALSVGAPVEFDVAEVSVGAHHEFNRYRIGGTFGHVDYNYHDAGLIDQDFRDLTEDSFTARLDAEISPRMGIFVQGRADQRDYDNAPGLNSDGRTYLAGVNINFTDLMRGELAAGYFQRDYDVGGNVDGLAVQGNLDWYITQLTTINFHGRREAQETGALASSPYIESEYGVRVDHELLRNMIVFAGASAGSRDYQVLTRKDDFNTIEAGADYILNRRVVLRGRVWREENDSTLAPRSFEVNSASLGVALRL